MDLSESSVSPTEEGLCGHLSEARIGSVRSQRKAISLSPHEENELIQGAAKKAASLGKNRVLAQEGK